MADSYKKIGTGPQLEIVFSPASVGIDEKGAVVYRGFPDLDELRQTGQSLQNSGLVRGFSIGGRGKMGHPEQTVRTITVQGCLGQGWDDLRAQISAVHPELSISDRADWMTYTQYAGPEGVPGGA